MVGVPNNKETLSYINVPKSIAVVLSKKMATLHEMDTVYSVEDVYDLLEIIYVDNYNNSKSLEDMEG